MPNFSDVLTNIVTIYGPLGLGWLAWWMERRDNQKNTEKIIEMYATASGTLAALKQLLDERLPKR